MVTANPLPTVASEMPINAESMLLWFEVTQLYNAESRALDEEDYPSWFDMLTEDLHYWMPTRETVYRKDESEDDPRQMNFYNESFQTLQMRVSRLSTGTAWSENPRTRYRHLITNVEVIEDQQSGEYQARSNFIVYRNRLDREESWLVGKREDQLRRVDGQLKIARRKITLDQNVLLSKNLNVYL
ncbi:MAG: 3-phenylpropionate/cinnamic acid dioxygenase subunit beta [Immundisolibacteraceae bacterium]|nr:3-phenylpropionate/cinnamic acid dioxygenase subunit beta [Immundisolibacteraceae bacterium]